MSFSYDCLKNVSFNNFVLFVHKFPETLFKPIINVDWKQFYFQKKEERLVKFHKI